MGRGTKARPLRLAAKLLCIRAACGLSQNELLRSLGHPVSLTQRSISKYESDLADPPLTVLLQYARLANLYVEVLLDDDLDLPSNLPSSTKHAGSPRKKTKPRPPPAA